MFLLTRMCNYTKFLSWTNSCRLRRITARTCQQQHAATTQDEKTNPKFNQQKKQWIPLCEYGCRRPFPNHRSESYNTVTGCCYLTHSHVPPSPSTNPAERWCWDNSPLPSYRLPAADKRLKKPTSESVMLQNETWAKRCFKVTTAPHWSL